MSLLGATGLMGALALRCGSVVETLLVAYVVGWGWLIAALVVLSPFEAVSASALWIALALGVLAAGGAWLSTGARTMSLSPAIARLRDVRAGPVLALSAVTGGAFLYTLAGSFVFASNEGDALAYHIPRALLWRQQDAVGWIETATDPRINVMPPAAEIGQLATMLVTGGMQYVALPQSIALLATAAATFRLARKLGRSDAEALFSAALFASLPVVILQAGTALNDLVVCSFLASAAALLLSTSLAVLAIGSLSVALATGAKATAVFGVPLLALLFVAVRRRASIVPVVGLAVGVVLGSGWYWLNLAQTGSFDGAYATESGQRPSGLGEVATSMRQLVLDLLDRSGVRGDDLAVFAIAAGALALCGAVVAARGGDGRHLFYGAALAGIAPAVMEPTGRVLLAGWQEGWSLLGRRELGQQLPTEFRLSVLADAVESWYGPVLPLGLVLVSVTAFARRRRCRQWKLLLALAAAPLAAILLLAVSLTYDPFRGRFVMFAVALAAVSWGVLLASRALAWGVAVVAIVSCVMSLAMWTGRPTGLVLFEDDPGLVSREPIWRRGWVDQLLQLRPGAPEGGVIRFVDDTVPEGASIALALHENDFLSPYFGERLRRHVVLVPSGRDDLIGGVDWLVSAPRADVSPCPDAWRQEFGIGDWKVLVRVGENRC